MRRFTSGLMHLVLAPVAFVLLISCGPAEEGSSGQPDADVSVPAEGEHSSGASESDAGEPKACGGIAGFACGEGEYCQMAEGTCQIADNMGVCQPKVEMCTRDYRPVCGCDGKTYGNACTAASFGVSIDYQGECKE